MVEEGQHPGNNFDDDSDAQDLDSGDEVCRAPDLEIANKWKRQRDEDDQKWPKGDKLIDQEMKGTSRHGGERGSFRDDRRSGKGRSAKGGHRGKGEGDRRAQPKRRLTDRISAKAPDHMKNPDKYTFYSLEGVSHSKAQNTTAAFDLINQLRQQREGGSSDKKTQSVDAIAKPVFNKPPVESKLQNMSVQPAVRSMASGTRVMGECVAGQKKIVVNKTGPKIQAKVNKNKLSIGGDSDSDDSMS